MAVCRCAVDLLRTVSNLVSSCSKNREYDFRSTLKSLTEERTDLVVWGTW